MRIIFADSGQWTVDSGHEVAYCLFSAYTKTPNFNGVFVFNDGGVL